MQVLAQQSTVINSDIISSNLNDAARGAHLECRYHADEPLFLAPDHTYIANLAVESDLDSGNGTSLGIQMYVQPNRKQSLDTAYVRIIIRNSTGKAVLNWRSKTLNNTMPLANSFLLSVPVELSQHDYLMLDDEPCHFFLMLENENGYIIDDASGEIVFSQ